MDKIEELLTRGVDKIYPTREGLEKVLRSGKKLKLYQGFDPTGTDLHIGHMIGLRKLKQWQDLGHHVIFLIGDFTAMVGDPSGKLSSRKMLSHDEVMKNAASYAEQASKILDFITSKNPVQILYNGDWLSKMTAIDFLRFVGHLTYNQLIERDMFQERIKRNQDIYGSEFLYPFMQAYDSVHMEVDLEVGGSDQTFNMLMGRKLMRNMLKRDKFVMTTPLLEDSQGRKIGKTEGNVIGLTDKPDDLYGKIMSLSDDVVIRGLEYLTDIPMNEITSITEQVKQGENPMQFKKRLAFEIVKQLNTEEDAQRAQETFEKIVQHKDASGMSVETKMMKAGTTVIDAIVELGFAQSRSDAKRLIDQGGVAINDTVITNPLEKLTGEPIIRVGNRKFGKIHIQ